MGKAFSAPLNKKSRAMPIKGKALSWPWLIDIACVLVLAAGVAVNLYLSRDWPLFHDGPIQHYIAWRILEGAVPYRDLFDMNMPGIYLLHMLCLKLFGGGDLAFRLFDALFLLLSAGGILALAGRERPLHATMGALFLMAIHLLNGPAYMAQRDFLLLPFLLFAFYFLRRFCLQRQHVALFFYGLLMGYGFWMKPVAALFILMSIGVVFWQLRGMKERLQALIWMALGGLIPTVLLLGWLYHIGGLAAFYDVFLHFTLQTYSHLHPLRWQEDMLDTSIGCIPLLAILLALLFKRSDASALDEVLITNGLIYGLLHFYTQGKGWDYHLYPFYAFLALYITFLSSLHFKKRDIAIVFHSMLLLAGLILFPWYGDLHPSQDKTFISSYEAQVKDDAAQALQSVPPPLRQADRSRAIQFFDFTQGHLWNVAYRQKWVVPARHIYPFPFYASQFPGPEIKLLEQELLRSLDETRPLVIFISRESWPYKDETLYHIIDKQPPWQAWFAEYYRLVKQSDRYRVYARRK
jgi:hypothetical protein